MYRMAIETVSKPHRIRNNKRHLGALIDWLSPPRACVEKVARESVGNPICRLVLRTRLENISPVSISYRQVAQI